MPRSPGGLLIDRIPAATERAADIIESLLVAVARCVDDEESAPSELLAQLAHLMRRAENADESWEVTVQKALERAGSDRSVRAGIVLGALSVPLPAARVFPLIETLRRDNAEAAALAEALLFGNSVATTTAQKALLRLYDAVSYYALISGEGNLIASIIAGSLPWKNTMPMISIMIKCLIWGMGGNSTAPFTDFVRNNTLMHFFPGVCEIEIDSELKKYFRHDKGRDWVRVRVRDRDRVRDWVRDWVRVRVWDWVRDRDRDWVRDLRHDMGRDVWSVLANERSVQDVVIEAVIRPLKLSHVPIWRETLRRHFLPALQQRHSVFRPETLEAIASASPTERFEGPLLQQAICWLLADSAFNLPEILPPPYRSILEDLVTDCGQSDHSILVFVRALRGAWSGNGIAIKNTIEMIEHPPEDLRAFLKKVGL